MEPPRGAPVRLRDLGSGPRTAAFRIACARARARRSRVLDITSPFRADAHHPELDSDRGAAARVAADDAWHQPMADSLARVQHSVIASLPARPSIIDQSIAGRDRLLESLRGGMAVGPIERAPNPVDGRNAMQPPRGSQAAPSSPTQTTG